MTTLFGDFVRGRRLHLRITLRSFCEQIGTDPANYSKVERGKLQPPKDQLALEKYRKTLNIETDSAEHRELLRLSELSRGELPSRSLNDSELASKLPAFFRSLDGDAVDEKVLDELVAMIRREH